MYADFSSTPFLAPGVELYDVKAPAPSLDLVDRRHHSVFVFLPERLGEHALLRAALPGGTLEQVHRQDDPNEPLLFTAYRVP